MTYQNRLQDQLIAANQRIKEQNYWLNKLSGQWTKTMFPVDYNKKIPGIPGASHVEVKTFRITGELFARLMKLRNNSDPRLFMIVLAGVTVLLYKYTGNEDILLGVPVLKQDIDAEFVNTTLVLRNSIRCDMSIKELLLQVRQTVSEAVENQNYPIETLPRQLNMTISGDQDFPLYDIVVLVENIHDINYIRHIKPNMIFSFLRDHQYIEGTVEYHPALYRKGTIARIIDHFMHLMENLLANVDIQISDIDILKEEEKKRLLFDFNNTETAYPGYENATIHQLFEEQAKRMPGQKALSYTIDLSGIYEDLEVEGVSRHLSIKYEGCSFKKNPYVFKFTNNDFLGSLDISDEKNPGEIILLKTHKHDYIAVNQSTLSLVDCFDGKRNLKTIFTAIHKKKLTFFVYPLTGVSFEISTSKEGTCTVIHQFDQLVLLAKKLCSVNLIDFVDYNPDPIDLDTQIDDIEKKLRKKKSEYSRYTAHIPRENKKVHITESPFKSPVLLLGDTPGTASVGLLYLASFLRRHSIEAYCHWNDFSRTPVLLKKNVENLILKIRPKVVGISMKWFLHIARVLEICRIVKNFDSSIEIVLGGNTASYYPKDFIRCEFVDYIVLGDGEVPLLKICKNEKEIPNCVYREAGQIIHTGINYVQDEKSSSDIYLSHLDEIFVSRSDPFLASSFMVYTGKGCAMSCFYCGACLEAQKKVFNRPRPFLRRVEEVRKDIQAAKEYAGTLMFDFDLPDYDVLDYYKKIFAGIHLSDHFCEMYFWKIPSPEFIDFISRTFKYAYLSIDLASLSERHRKQLTQLEVVKPQATDEELFRFFEQCKKYENVEVSISQIAGLPYFNDKDIAESHRVLSEIIEKYVFFTRIAWGRLHAQPGAPLTLNSQSHGMKSYAWAYDDFLKYSELNFKEEIYPDLATSHYPYIYSQDDNLNSKISKYYGDTEKKIIENKEIKKQRFIISKSLTYAELNEKANQLAGFLKQKGVRPEIIIGLRVGRSLEMIVGIMAILKAGGAYLPIDPEYPQSRIKYMLEDSGVDTLLTSMLTGGINANVNGMVSIVIDMSDPAIYGGTGSIPHPAVVRSGDSAYVIYTSGTTGRPKGVLVEHRSAVNTLRCRKTEYRLDSQAVSLQLFSYAFDGFVTSFFTPVISGAEVILPDDAAVKDLSRIKEIILTHRVTHFIGVPSLFQAILEELGKEELASLKIVTLAGEKLLPTTVELAKQKHPTLEIAQEYGVTEAAVMSTLYRNQQQDRQMKIGKPTWNTRIHILGKGNQLQPVGIPGELCIGGAGVTSGYLNNPELTVKKFIRDPFISPMTHNKSLMTIYRTGDLARWLSDGNIEFLGRLDQQIKNRGYRIEPGEIENLLLGHAGVKEVVVTTWQENKEDKSLVSYVVPDPQYAFTVKQLLLLEKERLLNDRQRHEMPNGMPIFHLNRSEVDLMYKDIFENQGYLNHGITLQEGDCVFDVGANIGMFSLFVNQICKKVTIYAFEPIPPILEVLKINAAMYGLKGEIFGLGISDKEDEVPFSYYPNASVLSGRYYNIEEEVNSVGTFILNQQKSEGKEDELSENRVSEFLKERLYEKRFSCPVKSLSQVIRENKIEKIDLLKIVAEKSELDVFKGINEEDWAKISQIVVEVYNIDGRLEEIKNLVMRHGYCLTVEQDPLLKKTNIYHVYAVLPRVKKSGRIKKKEELPGMNPGKNWYTPEQLERELRGDLNKKLPRYMIPAHFVLLAKLPLTPNGKIDRKSLPPPGIGKKEKTFVAPRDEVEQGLSDIYSNVLGIGKGLIDIEANFFEKGGHSLKANKLVSEINKAFNVKVTLAEVFKSPTIRELARYLKTAKTERFIPLEPVEKKDYYPTSSAQKRLFFLQEMNVNNTSYNLPEVVELEGNLDRERFKGAFEKLINRHESFRTSIEMINAEPVQRIHEQLEFEIEYYENTVSGRWVLIKDGRSQTERDAEEGKDSHFTDNANTRIRDFVRPFNLSQAPLIRVGLINIRKQKHVLMVDMHHIISDGISHGILIKDLTTLYRGNELSPLKLQYKDVSEWQNNEREKEKIEEQGKYWLKEFENEIPVLNLPTDYARPEVKSYEGNHISFVLNKEVTNKLNILVHQEGVTMYTLLLALFYVFISKISTNEDIVIGTPIAGRRHADLEEIIGMFVNTLALRNYPEKKKTFKEFLIELREKTLKAFENQEYQFEDLVAKVVRGRVAGRNPISDVGFTLQKIKAREEIHESNLKPNKNNKGISKFDLTLTGVETGKNLLFTFEYSTKLFKEETIERFIGYFKDIVSSILENINIKLKDISLNYNLADAKTTDDYGDFGF